MEESERIATENNPLLRTGSGPSTENGQDEPHRRIVSRASLILRLKRLLRSATFVLHVGYAVSVLLLFAFLAMFAFVEWVAQHFGIAIGEGVCFGAALVWLTRRYIEGRKILERARKSISHPQLDDDLFDILAQALKEYVGRGLEALSILITAYVAPLAVKAPDVVAHHFKINTDDGKMAVAAGVAAAAAGTAVMAVKLYEKVRDEAFQGVDEVVDHVDRMPQFDWLDRISGDEPDDEDENILRDDSETETEILAHSLI